MPTASNGLKVVVNLRRSKGFNGSKGHSGVTYQARILDHINAEVLKTLFA
jgi:hypothetical protein